MKSIFLGALQIMLYGTATWFLWNWFVVPATNLPVISYPVALGLSVIGILYTMQSPKKDTTKEDRRNSFLISIITPIFSTATGFIIQLFV